MCYKKTTEEAFVQEAQKFNEKAIYAKMPHNVKTILNRAYLEDKPYNDIVLHLERGKRLNGLGAPDETTLTPLNAVDTAPPEETKDQKQRGHRFHCGRYGHYKAQCRKPKKDSFYENKVKSTN